MGLITIGLKEVLVGEAAENGTMPNTLTKIGKVYKETININQDAPDVTEHFEEGRTFPEVRIIERKPPKVTFSLMDCDVQALVDYIGGEDIGDTDPVWGFNGDEDVPNRAIRIVSNKGLDFDIPNANIEAVINSDMSKKGIFLVEFTITPLAVTSGKAISATPKITA
jgi:hypothetical protein